MLDPLRPLVLMAASLLLLSGCAGYQLGTRTLYRPDIHTVYVPVFESESFRRNLGERLTEAVVKEIESKTPFKVVDSINADSTLSGRIVSERKQVIAENRNDEPRNIDVVFFVQVTWVDRRGHLITQSASLPLSPAALELTEAADFVPEAGQSLATAQQEVINEVAEQIVAHMEARW